MAGPAAIHLEGTSLQISAFPDDQLAPFDWYRTMRKAAPVYFIPEMNMWEVFRYNDVQRILTESATFSSRTVAPLAPRIAQIVRELITPAETRRTRAHPCLCFKPLCSLRTGIYHGMGR